MIRVDDLDELDFIKLVHANDASIIAARAAGFATEAGGLGGELDGEVGLGEEGIAVKIGDRDLGGRCEEELIVLGAIHVVLEFRELARTFHAFAFHDVGDIDLFIAVLLSLEIEEKLDEGALEFSSFTAIDGKARPRKAGAVVEANKAFRFGEFEVVLGIGDFGFVAP